MSDEMQRTALVRALLEFLAQLLHAVLAADIYPGGYRLAHAGSVVHLRCPRKGARPPALCRF